MTRRLSSVERALRAQARFDAREERKRQMKQQQLRSTRRRLRAAASQLAALSSGAGPSVGSGRRVALRIHKLKEVVKNLKIDVLFLRLDIEGY